MTRMTPVDLEDDVEAAVPVRRRWSSRTKWALTSLAVGVALAAGLLFSWVNIDADSGIDLLGLIKLLSTDAQHLRWQFAGIVVALAVLHYMATAVAARVVSGVPLPLAETFLVQFAAAAANRLTPAGLGGSAVNARYFTRRGQSASAALGAVALLSVVAAAADLLVLCALVLVGGWFGLAGSRHELGLITSHLRALVGALASPWLWGLVAVAGLGLLLAIGLTRRRHANWTQVWQPAARLARRPGQLLMLLGATASTTLILAFAFTASIAMVPGPAPKIGLGAMVIAFMLASALGSAVPTPAGIGSTESAFAAVLISAQVPVGHAIEIVLLYRLLTFWAPAVVGIPASRFLHRRNAL